MAESQGAQTETENQQEESRREIEERVLELKREKRSRKTAVTKCKHYLERMCVAKGEINEETMQQEIQQLWSMLETSLTIMDELSSVYIRKGDLDSKNASVKEAEDFEVEIQGVIERSEGVIKDHISQRHSHVVESGAQGSLTPPSMTNPSVGSESSSSHQSQFAGHRLKPLKVPGFDGDKTKFEDFWSLFNSLVDEGNESTSIKMARLRQSLSGPALEAIRGLGVTDPEYKEAKEILKTKFGGERRKLQAYMDELEAMKNLDNRDVQSFERFTDLVRIAVVKLKAEGRDGELGDGALHSLLVKKLGDRQVESYSRWLREHEKERSVLNLGDWLKKEVRIRVEAVEMAHGIESKYSEVSGAGTKRAEKGFRPRTFFNSGTDQASEKHAAVFRLPCVFCQGNHGVWSCKQFKDLRVDNRWSFAKEKHLCFRCLGSNHRGKECTRSKLCDINGCKKNHHYLLHDSTRTKESDKSVLPREGAQTHVHTSTCNQVSTKEAYSLRTVPVWLKANDRKIKVNAILDDGSNETFLNEEVAGVLGIKERYETVRVNVLNNEVETFQSMPLSVTIESVDGQFSKEIDVKTCPQNVTGNYKVEDWNNSKAKWAHLKECDFAKPQLGMKWWTY